LRNPVDKHTNKHTNKQTQTGAITIHCAA